MTTDRTEARRRFLKLLAGSPLIGLWLPIGSLEKTIAAALLKPGGPSLDDPTLQKLITSPDQALNVFDFEAAAKQTLPPAHWGYMATGVDDDATLHANRTALSRLQIRPRRLIDVTRIDTTTEIFGVKW